MEPILGNPQIRRSARSLFVACIADLLAHYVELPNPMVVGKGYPSDRLVKECEAWAKTRNLTIADIDVDGWQNLWKSGLLK